MTVLIPTFPAEPFEFNSEKCELWSTFAEVIVKIKVAHFLPAWCRKRDLYYGDVGGWLAGCHTPYCIKTAKPIWNFFWPSESPIILVSWDPCANTQFQWEPLQRGR